MGPVCMDIFVFVYRVDGYKFFLDTRSIYFRPADVDSYTIYVHITPTQRQQDEAG